VIYSPAAEVLVLEDDAESAEGNPIELNPELGGVAEPGTTEGTTGNTRYVHLIIFLWEPNKNI
jgi:hypothetical protein